MILSRQKQKRRLLKGRERIAYFFALFFALSSLGLTGTDAVPTTSAPRPEPRDTAARFSRGADSAAAGAGAGALALRLAMSRAFFASTPPKEPLWGAGAGAAITVTSGALTGAGAGASAATRLLRHCWSLSLLGTSCFGFFVSVLALK